MILTEQLIRGAATVNGGFRKRQLAMLNVKWPPPGGWLKRVVEANVEFTDEQYTQFAVLGVFEGKPTNPKAQVPDIGVSHEKAKVEPHPDCIKAIAEFADAKVGPYRRECVVAFNACESPIEERMLAALISSCRDRENLVLAVGGGPCGLAGTAYGAYLIHLQPGYAGYRPDFVVSWRIASEPDMDVSVVVECDGHEFHERTKEQARSDRVRDRSLLRAGYATMRFAGSEIWAGSLECAKEVWGQLASMEDMKYAQLDGSS